MSARHIPPQINLPMACCCGEERKAKLDALVNSRSASQMLHELYWEHGYTLDYVGVDMWMGTKATHMDNDWDEEDLRGPRHAPIRIEFDIFEHGLAALIEHLKIERA